MRFLKIGWCVLRSRLNVFSSRSLQEILCLWSYPSSIGAVFFMKNTYSTVHDSPKWRIGSTSLLLLSPFMWNQAWFHGWWKEIGSSFLLLGIDSLLIDSHYEEEENSKKKRDVGWISSFLISSASQLLFLCHQKMDLARSLFPWCRADPISFGGRNRASLGIIHGLLFYSIRLTLLDRTADRK